MFKKWLKIRENNCKYGDDNLTNSDRFIIASSKGAIAVRYNIQTILSTFGD